MHSLEIESWNNSLQGLLLLEEYKSNPLVTVMVAPHAAYTVDDYGFQQSLHFASVHKLQIHTHLHESQSEVENHSAQYEGMRPITRLNKLGTIYLLWRLPYDLY
jgi:5-methylthioadenosine/S-adenosylhomocysteine deaminase